MVLSIRHSHPQPPAPQQHWPKHRHLVLTACMRLGYVASSLLLLLGALSPHRSLLEMKSYFAGKSSLPGSTTTPGRLRASRGLQRRLSSSRYVSLHLHCRCSMSSCLGCESTSGGASWASRHPPQHHGGDGSMAGLTVWCESSSQTTPGAGSVDVAVGPPLGASGASSRCFHLGRLLIIPPAGQRHLQHHEASYSMSRAGIQAYLHCNLRPGAASGIGAATSSTAAHPSTPRHLRRQRPRVHDKHITSGASVSLLACSASCPTY